MEKDVIYGMIFLFFLFVCWVLDVDYDFDIGNDVLNVIGIGVFWFCECFIFFEVKLVVVFLKN